MILKKCNFYINKDYNIGFSFDNLEFYHLNDMYIDNMINYEENKNYSDKIIEEIKSINKDELNEDNTSYCIDFDILKVDTLKILVTQVCNLSCKYCYANGGNYNEKPSIMSKEVAYLISENINKFENLKNICFFGGEPLLNLDAIEIICKNIKKEIKLYIQTNGTIMNDRTLDVLEKYQIDVTISLDGPKEINDINRVFKNGKGTYDIISKNIKTLLKEGINVSSIEGTLDENTLGLMRKKEIKDFYIDEFGIYNSAIFEDVKLEKDIIENNDFNYSVELLEKNNVLYSELYSKILNHILSRTSSDYFVEQGEQTYR